jgi:hypothetical protein
VFEQVRQDARNEAEAIAAGNADRSLRGKRWPDGRSYDELTPSEQLVAKQAVGMGLKPWEQQEDPDVLQAQPKPDAVGGWTAENFLDE